MSIKIHWGAPGSFKTSGALAEDFVLAVIAGRTIVTNVRGLDDEALIRQVLSEVRFPHFWSPKIVIPDTFRLIHIPTHECDNVEENRQYWARWFQWMPKDAYIFLDEAQDVFTKDWTTKDLAKFEFPGGSEAAALEHRPYRFAQAFQMHRHYGWDFVLTTPNISLIRSDIRACADGGYYHENQANIGLPGIYLEVFHIATNTGKGKDALATRPFRKVPSYVWKLYKSTATGGFRDTLSGLSLFKNPRFVFLIIALFATFSYLAHLGTPKIFNANNTKQVTKTNNTTTKPVIVKTTPLDSKDNTNQAVNAGSNDVATRKDYNNAALDPLSGYTIRITTIVKSDTYTHYRYYAENDDTYQYLDDGDLIGMGYAVTHKGNCNTRLYYSGGFRFVGCHERRKQKTPSLIVAKTPDIDVVGDNN